MNILKRLWADELGVILSAETVMTGTIGVLAVTAGVGTMATAVNGELNEMGMAFRSFNQSYSVPGYRVTYGVGGGASFSDRSEAVGFTSGSMGSSYRQPPVEESQLQLKLQFARADEVRQYVSGRVIQRLDGVQLERFRDTVRDNVGSGSAL